MKNTMKALFAGVSMLAVTGGAQAADLSFAGGWPPNSAPTAKIEDYAKAVEEYSNGEVSVRVFPLSLLSFGEINAGLRDGIADVAGNLLAYFPAEYPTLNMLAEFSELVELEEFSGELSSLAFTGAIMDYVMNDCPACIDEMSAQNQVYLGASSTTSYALQCAVPLSSVGDLEGKRLRAAGAYWARWAESVGAVPVSMSVNETLEGLSQGVVDCTMSNTADFVNFGFIDVVDYVYIGAPGAQFNVPFTMNKDSWNGLSDDNKQAMLRAHAKLAADIAWVYIEEGRAGRERAPGEGIEYGAAPDDIVAMNREFIQEDKDAIAEIYNERFGIESGAEAAAALTESLGKWTELTKDVSSGEELAEIYWNEIFSKIDVASYGQ
ncbi:C4-dicarboxylate TRAP transporter substrate-binding protein [Lutimaribacter sp. EGI FJ00015]|uniref:C4-dicarboxylate TRAP transporter substrate-binding protein n=1 Tax=Lutimaribacter degradans TaxID=2945989 RepID=A0ACC5ZZB4_9RHOB|nr:C4-dicarboxylate TRAP transporter substrate-binding protein [Lutimaribacter sp. EGI FJ00013]MCM2563382.1 C4-dicarboxylate TRAP transporter substrate-binding protein [Lutimaribacter sp. EGI FJ00013]MCO0614539.1 C4-dicarboxylate TRAP transporter substrate-binding protein [Lutimaribacter sp. EGI FJ00015]MCO0637212.1 C4-dicarboxylate TRAP transporter substrate-binding protein [Lutimaribacter sp. EGI FJ00014]